MATSAPASMDLGFGTLLVRLLFSALLNAVAGICGADSRSGLIIISVSGSVALCLLLSFATTRALINWPAMMMVMVMAMTMMAY